jgi:outer membrane protein TolC
MLTRLRRVLAPAYLLVGLGPLFPIVSTAEPAPPPPAPPETEAPVRRLTFEEAIRVALQNNPGLRVAVENRQVAEGRLGEARAATRPQVSASGTYTVQGPVTSFEIPGPTGTQRVELNQRDVRRGQITATLDTDLAGRQSSLRRIARLGVRAAEDAVDQAQNSLVFDVQSAYLEALRTGALVRVARDAVAAAREQLRVAEAQFRAGVVPQFDVLRASVQVENLRQNQITAENQERQSDATLIQILGIEPTTRLELVPLLPPVPTAEPEAVPPPVVGAGEIPPSLAAEFPRALEPALAQAYVQRPELQQIEENVRQARERVEFERRARRPNLFITGNYNFTPDASGFAANDTSWDVTANLSLPIFTAGLIRSRVRIAQNELDALLAQREQTRQAVAREVKAALLNLSEAEARLSTAAANVVQAREALRIARVRYQAGVSTTVEVTDAEVALTQAQTNQVNAEYDVLTARAAVLQALGRYADVTTVPPPM